MKHTTLAILAGLCATIAQAATPAELLAGYRAEAVRQIPAFQPDARRGAEFFARRFGVSEKMPACAACHMENPAQAGRHVVTDKAIKPLAPAANDRRLTELAKTEKWFGRNCKEVVGRECSAAEKADFVAFLMEVR
ncbi:MAG: DUF1924 domain-containing protein [Pseudomonadota bacterium]